MGFFDNQYTTPTPQEQPPIPTPEPEPEPVVEPEPAVDDNPSGIVPEPAPDAGKTKPRTRTKTHRKPKNGVNAALIGRILDAHAILDQPSVRDILTALGARNADADMTLAILDGLATPVAALAAQVTAETEGTARMRILLMADGKDPKILTRFADVAAVLDPDATATAGDRPRDGISLAQWLADLTGRIENLDRLEPLA